VFLSALHATVFFILRSMIRTIKRFIMQMREVTFYLYTKAVDINTFSTKHLKIQAINQLV
jgi:hypothetical protein